MIEIKNEEIWGKVVAEELASVNGNRLLTTWEVTRFVNALAKATARIERDGVFMDFDRKSDKLIIWSNSNEIYEINGDKTCQCRAFLNGNVCWHRAAKRLVSRYLLAEAVEMEIEHLTEHQGWTRSGAMQYLGV